MRWKPFYKPTYCEYQEDELGIHYVTNINHSKYKAKLRRASLVFWDVVSFYQDYEGIKNMSSDKFWEAYNAYDKLTEDVKKGGEQ